MVAILLSLNSKFYSSFDDAQTLFSTISNSSGAGAIQGCELAVDPFNDKEKQFVKEFVNYFSNADWILQIHAPALSDDCDWKKLLFYYDMLRKEANQTSLLVIVHPLDSSYASENSVAMTISFLDRLVHIVQKWNLSITFLVENLDTLHNKKRVGVDELQSFLFSEHTGFCWDIGHELRETKQFGNLNQVLLQNLRSIHLHGDANGGHQSITTLSVSLENIISYLESIFYSSSIVLEVALDNLSGNSINEKIEAYLKEAWFVQKAFE